MGLSLAAPGICDGQTLFDEGPSLEFRTNEPWSRIQLEGREEINGVSPLRVPGPLTGEFWLSAWGPGMELQRGRVAVRLDEGGTGITSYGRRSWAETMLFSLLYPGIVQYGQGQEGKGLYLGSVATVAAVGSIVSAVQLWNARSDLLAARRAFHSAPTFERHERLNTVHDMEAERDLATDRRTVLLIGTATVWGVSLLDATLFSPDFRVRSADAGVLALDLQPKSRLRAVVRSLLFPGLGQEYNGESTKAAWVATGAVAAGLWFMYRQDEYAKAVTDYNKAHRRFLAARSVEEQAPYSAEQDDRYSRVEDRKRDRNIAIGILAGYWGVAALETMLSFGDSWGDQRVRQTGGIGLVVDPMEGAVAAQWTF